MGKYSRVCVICQNPFSTNISTTKACSPKCGTLFSWQSKPRRIKVAKPPLKRNNANSESDFWSRVDKSDVENCWIWTGNNLSSGYGRFSYQGKSYQVHRLSYLFTYKVLPDKLFVCHACDTPLCVNPSHLWLGSHLDNMRDKVSKGRHIGKGRHKNYIPDLRTKPPKPFNSLKTPGKKINWEIATKIRQLYSTRKYTYPDLAKLFGINKSTIGQVVRGQIWNYE